VTCAALTEKAAEKSKTVTNLPIYQKISQILCADCHKYGPDNAEDSFDAIQLALKK